MIKVSVCVPVYRVEDYIDKCASSLFGQTLDAVEYIFVDDCSPDRSIEVLRQTLKRYPDRAPHVTILHNDVNSGPGQSRKRAGEIAKGEFLYFPDSDDWIDADMLERMYDKATTENADIVTCGYINEYSGGRSAVSTELYNLSGDEWRRRIITCDGVYIGLATSLIKNDLYRNATTDYPTERLYAFEDYLMSVKLHFLSEKSAAVTHPFYHRNVVNPYSVSKTSRRQTESKLTVAAAVDEFFSRRADRSSHASEIARFKATAKAGLISSSSDWDPERWRTLWPELNDPDLIIPYGVVNRLQRSVAGSVAARHDITARIKLLAGSALLDIARKLRAIIAR